MSRYELYLLVHILGAIVWVGAHANLQFLALRAERSGDDAGLKQVLDDGDALAKIIIPASLAVVIAGVLMVLDGPWSFSMLWIDLGLAGFAATFVTGMFLLEPAGKRLSAVVEAEGGFTPPAAAQAKRLLAIARVDALVIVLVVAVMVAKPTGEDVAFLLVLAAILLAGAVAAVRRTRAIDAGEAAPATA
jgi:uncharacterized membrane protein